MDAGFSGGQTRHLKYFSFKYRRQIKSDKRQVDLIQGDWTIKGLSDDVYRRREPACLSVLVTQNLTVQAFTDHFTLLHLPNLNVITPVFYLFNTMQFLNCAR